MQREGRKDRGEKAEKLKWQSSQMNATEVDEERDSFCLDNDTLSARSFRPWYHFP